MGDYVTTVAQIRYSVDFAWLVLIWLVQIIIYPSFHFVQPTSFVHWHQRYTNSISYFVGPLLLLQLSIYGWLTIAVGDWTHFINFGLVIALCACTALLSVPCHNALHQHGHCERTINRLVMTNWPRTIGWTAIVVVNLIAEFSTT